jgi:hypothetical protein
MVILTDPYAYINKEDSFKGLSIGILARGEDDITVVRFIKCLEQGGNLEK